MGTSRVLIVDDDFFLNEIFQMFLEDRGHQVQCFVRARLVDGVVTLMDVDGKESAFDAASHDVALIDGNIKRSPLSGAELTRLISAQGLPVVAISGAPSLNDDNVRAGAILAVRKDLLYDQVKSGELDFEKLKR